MRVIRLIGELPPSSFPVSQRRWVMLRQWFLLLALGALAGVTTAGAAVVPAAKESSAKAAACCCPCEPCDLCGICCPPCCPCGK